MREAGQKGQHYNNNNIPTNIASIRNLKLEPDNKKEPVYQRKLGNQPLDFLRRKRITSSELITRSEKRGYFELVTIPVGAL
jgi:hypothetical protein